MLKIILERWEKNKDKLKEVFRTQKAFMHCSYKYFVKTVFDVIYNTNASRKSGEKVFTDKIHQINDNKYGDTLLYIIPLANHILTECDYLITYVRYGSCSITDTLMEIWESNKGEYLNEKQVKDFMTLAKDILQNTIKPYNYGWRNDGRFERIEIKNDD